MDFGLVNPAALDIQCSGIHFHCASSELPKQGVLTSNAQCSKSNTENSSRFIEIVINSLRNLPRYTWDTLSCKGIWVCENVPGM